MKRPPKSWWFRTPGTWTGARLLKTYYDATAETPADVLHPTLLPGTEIRNPELLVEVVVHVDSAGSKWPLLLDATEAYFGIL